PKALGVPKKPSGINNQYSTTQHHEHEHVHNNYQNLGKTSYASAVGNQNLSKGIVHPTSNFNYNLPISSRDGAVEKVNTINDKKTIESIENCSSSNLEVRNITKNVCNKNNDTVADKKDKKETKNDRAMGSSSNPAVQNKISTNSKISTDKSKSNKKKFTLKK
ncbi:hypothetical protein PV327_011453, partial [Microctonus hyperodae]